MTKVDFSRKIRDWDGFGVNYVETSQTPDYKAYPQDYGGFSILKEEDRQKIIDMIFGEDGLKPGIIKMFLDPFHQDYSKLNRSDLYSIDLSNYDHITTTKWMRYFAKEGLKRVRERGDDLKIIITLYGPPGWMTKQKFIRGRDLDPAFKVECAKYMISWAKYLREEEGLPVKYISLHNEGEDYHRWPKEGDSPNWEYGHDYNLYWPPSQVVEFIKLVRNILNKVGLNDIGVTPGETSNWYRFSNWGYAYAIADDLEAVESLGLITSHGFYNGKFGKGYGDHRSLGNDILREKNQSLHSWVTSTSWGKMDADFIFEIYDSIYSVKINALIPWACIQRPSQWFKGDPNPGTAFRVYEDGTFSVEDGYYFYKQVSRAGQPGMAVVRTITDDSDIAIIGFSSNNTKNPDSFVVINLSEQEKYINIEIIGSKSNYFLAYRTSNMEKYSYIGKFPIYNNAINYQTPPRSVTTFFGGLD
jgi:O-glycosyl hydrolase